MQSVCEPLLSALGYAPDDVEVSAAQAHLGLGNGSVRGRSRAAVVNRRRLGKATQYVRTRARAAFSRQPL